MKGMVLKVVVSHVDDELEGEKEVWKEEHPVARVTWKEEVDNHMLRVGGQTVVERYFNGLADEARKGLNPTLSTLSKRVLSRFKSASDKARGAKAKPVDEGAKAKTAEEAD